MFSGMNVSTYPSREAAFKSLTNVYAVFSPDLNFLTSSTLSPAPCAAVPNNAAMMIACTSTPPNVQDYIQGIHDQTGYRVDRYRLLVAARLAVRGPRRGGGLDARTSASLVRAFRALPRRGQHPGKKVRTRVLLRRFGGADCIHAVRVRHRQVSLCAVRFPAHTGNRIVRRVAADALLHPHGNRVRSCL